MNKLGKGWNLHLNLHRYGFGSWLDQPDEDSSTFNWPTEDCSIVIVSLPELPAAVYIFFLMFVLKINEFGLLLFVYSDQF